jgi:hypothetical protein
MVTARAAPHRAAADRTQAGITKIPAFFFFKYPAP